MTTTLHRLHPSAARVGGSMAASRLVALLARHGLRVGGRAINRVRPGIAAHQSS